MTAKENLAVVGCGEPKIAHVFPRIDDTVIGGTYEENEFALEPDEFETWEIIERCKSVLPQLADVPDEDILAGV